MSLYSKILSPADWDKVRFDSIRFDSEKGPRWDPRSPGLYTFSTSLLASSLPLPVTPPQHTTLSNCRLIEIFPRAASRGGFDRPGPPMPGPRSSRCGWGVWTSLFSGVYLCCSSSSRSARPAARGACLSDGFSSAFRPAAHCSFLRHPFAPCTTLRVGCGLHMREWRYRWRSHTVTLLNRVHVPAGPGGAAWLELPM